MVAAGNGSSKSSSASRSVIAKSRSRRPSASGPVVSQTSVAGRRLMQPGRIDVPENRRSTYSVHRSRSSVARSSPAGSTYSSTVCERSERRRTGSRPAATRTVRSTSRAGRTVQRRWPRESRARPAAPRPPTPAHCRRRGPAPVVVQEPVSPVYEVRRQPSTRRSKLAAAGAGDYGRRLPRRAVVADVLDNSGPAGEREQISQPPSHVYITQQPGLQVGGCSAGSKSLKATGSVARARRSTPAPTRRRPGSGPRSSRRRAGAGPPNSSARCRSRRSR